MTVTEIVAADAQARPAFHVPWRPALMALVSAFNVASETRLVTPCIMAAVADRETNGQNIFQLGVPRGPGCGVGPWQITSGVDWTDLAHPTFPNYGDLTDVMVTARVAAHEFLEGVLEQFPSSHVAAFAAYNLGGGAVAREIAAGISPDAWTTDHDYGLDVFTRFVNFTAATQGVPVDWSTWKP